MFPNRTAIIVSVVLTSTQRTSVINIHNRIELTKPTSVQHTQADPHVYITHTAASFMRFRARQLVCEVISETPIRAFVRRSGVECVG